jgi:hypothetical protein
MVTVSCDVCGTQRTSMNIETWILGFDIPAASAPMKRSLKFLERWEERRVLDPGAVHFCCEECRDTYVENALAA